MFSISVGVFHLAGLLSDGIFSSTTQETWNSVVDAKVQGSQNLDLVCREYQKQIKTFVCFSSIVAAFGNAGQCSYGYANSVLDSICRSRVADHLPALSLQWGLIGVGMGVNVEQVIV